MLRALDLPALQDALHVSRSTLWRYMHASRPAKARLHRVAGVRRVLVAEHELDRWLRENTTEAR